MPEAVSVEINRQVDRVGGGLEFSFQPARRVQSVRGRGTAALKTFAARRPDHGCRA
jgi:hypothetical protein